MFVTMNGTLNTKWLKCRLWYLEEEEDFQQEEEDTVDIDENQF